LRRGHFNARTAVQIAQTPTTPPTVDNIANSNARLTAPLGNSLSTAHLQTISQRRSGRYIRTILRKQLEIPPEAARGFDWDEPALNSA
jgi:hypothetical protein